MPLRTRITAPTAPTAAADERDDTRIGTMANAPSDAALAQWIRDLHATDPAARSTALAHLQEYPDALASVAPALLGDDDAAVRCMALSALAATTHPDLESWLLRVLANETDVNVCAAAVDLLGEVGTGAARSALETLPARFPEHPYVRFAVQVAIERLTDG